MGTWEEHEAFLEDMGTWLRKHWEEAELELNQPTYEAPQTEMHDIGGFKTVEILPGTKCTHWWQRGPAWPFEQCEQPAGAFTLHEGVGKCNRHGGNYGRGAIQGAVLMANAFADELNVSPWEGMLQQVRLLANQVNWLAKRVNEAEKISEDSIMPGGDKYYLVALLEARGDRLAKVSKMAIDAGIAERFVRQVELEGELMYKATLHALGLEGIEGAAQERILSALAEKLLELEGEVVG